MERVKLVTDSTADLPKELVERYGIHVVPLGVHMGDEVYMDGVDITATAFYGKLKEMDGLPTTSQPSPGYFKDVYEKLGEDGSTIISIHISSKLSGTYQSAVLARDMLESIDIKVIDSETVSMALGLIVVNIAKVIEEGKTQAEILDYANQLISQNEVFFVVDTLEYLEKGGRIGKAQALLGSVLNIKPILTIADGVVTPVEKVRGHKKALDRIIQIAKEYAEGKIQVSLIHGDNQWGLELLKLKAEEEININEFVISEVGPVVGTHAGPGVLAIVTQKL